MACSYCRTPAGCDLPGATPPPRQTGAPRRTRAGSRAARNPTGRPMGTSCARGRCARPGRTLRTWRLIAVLALEIRRRPPACLARWIAYCGRYRHRAPRQRDLRDSEASHGGRAAANAERDAEPEPSRPQVACRQARGRGLIPRSSRPGRARDRPGACLAGCFEGSLRSRQP